MCQVRLKTAPVVPWEVALLPGSMALLVERQVLGACDEAGMDVAPS